MDVKLMKRGLPHAFDSKSPNKCSNFMQWLASYCILHANAYFSSEVN